MPRPLLSCLGFQTSQVVGVHVSHGVPFPQNPPPAPITGDGAEADASSLGTPARRVLVTEGSWRCLCLTKRASTLCPRLFYPGFLTNRATSV